MTKIEEDEMEDNKNEKLPKFKTNKTEDHQNGRQPKLKTTKILVTNFFSGTKSIFRTSLLSIPSVAMQTQLVLLSDTTRYIKTAIYKFLLCGHSLTVY